MTAKMLLSNGRWILSLRRAPTTPPRIPGIISGSMFSKLNIDEGYDSNEIIETGITHVIAKEYISLPPDEEKNFGIKRKMIPLPAPSIPLISPAQNDRIRTAINEIKFSGKIADFIFFASFGVFC